MSNNPRPGSDKPYNFYDILHLPRRGGQSSLFKDEIKAAYRRALLIYHPDKVSNKDDTLKASTNGAKTPTTSKYTIDEIVAAYQVLLDPSKRAEYDQSLERVENGDTSSSQKGTHIGVEEYDLEDMTFDEDKNTWSRSCRCGDGQGYILTDQDLERESQNGEIYVGCRGCSLFIKVLFAVEEHE